MACRSVVVFSRDVALAAITLGLGLGLSAGVAQAKDAGTSAPVTPAGLSGIVDLDAWFSQTCAVVADGTVRCWGSVAEVPSGNAVAPVIEPAPLSVPGISQAKRVSGRCVVKHDGTVWCWGPTWLSATPDPGDAPTQKAGIDGAIDLDAGTQNVVCVLRTDAAVWCWGTSRFGATGNPPQAPGAYTQESPLPVPGLTNATSVAVGEQHACAARQGGELWCWGSGVGGGVPAARASYADTVGVAAATTATCAVGASGGVRCFGDNAFGEMGVRPDGYASGAEPIVGLPAMTSVSTADTHTCAVTTTGSGWCWGLQQDGRLGNPAYGGDGTSESPIPVLGLTTIRAFETGSAHTCALLTDDTVRCFGSDAAGQLGNGDDPLPADWPLDTPGAIQQADSTPLVRLPGTPTPTTAPLRQSTPAPKPTPQVARSGNAVVLTAFQLTVRTGRSCPARVTITLRPQRKRAPTQRQRVATTRARGICAVNARLTLSRRLTDRSLAVTVTGTGVRTRTRALPAS